MFGNDFLCVLFHWSLLISLSPLFSCDRPVEEKWVLEGDWTTYPCWVEVQSCQNHLSQHVGLYTGEGVSEQEWWWVHMLSEVWPNVLFQWATDDKPTYFSDTSYESLFLTPDSKSFLRLLVDVGHLLFLWGQFNLQVKCVNDLSSPWFINSLVKVRAKVCLDCDYVLPGSQRLTTERADSLKTLVSWYVHTCVCVLKPVMTN